MKITMNWNDLDINEMTNLFLYGALNTPTDLEDDALLNHETVELTLTDVASFMIDGPGRFANATYSSLVRDFMAGRIMPDNGIVQTMTAEQLEVAGHSRFFTLSQVEYGINAADFDLRAYIYGHTGFAINKDAVFTVDADGTRHIENLAVLPGQDDFDFTTTSDLQVLGEFFLEDKIDPSGIGRTVKMFYRLSDK